MKNNAYKKVLKEIDYLFLDADYPTTRGLLSNPYTEQIRPIITDNKFIFLDEAQRIKGVVIDKNNFRDFEVVK